MRTFRRHHFSPVLTVILFCLALPSAHALDCNANGVTDAAEVSRSLLVASMATDGVLRFEADSGLFIDQLVATGAGGLSAPRGMLIGPDGKLYVSSSANDQVLRYDGQTGAFIDVFISAGSGGLDWPHALLFDPNGDLLVSSRNTQSVLRFSGQTGTFLGEFITAGSGGLSLPHGLAYGAEGNLYVVSRGNSQVLRYDGVTGAFLNVFTSGGGLRNPIELEFGPDGHLYVTGRENNAVLRFDAITGAYIDTYASGGGLSKPTGMAFHSAGNLLISSLDTDQVLNYAATTGVSLGVFASGSGLDNPGFLAIAEPLGRDCNLNRIPDSCDIDAGASRDVNGDGVPDECAPVTTSILMVFEGSTEVPGVGVVENEDVVAFDTATGLWSLVFDGSDVGLAATAIDALAVRGAAQGIELLLSFRTPVTLPGLIGGPDGGTTVDDSDIVVFTPTSLGAVTAGTFNFYFDGSDVGLDTNGEDIDGLALTADGKLLISTLDRYVIPGESGDGKDVLLFEPTSLGAVTAGTFTVWMDGSDVGLDTADENIDALAVDADGSLLLSFPGLLQVPEVSADDEDLVRFVFTQTGATTTGTFSFAYDLGALGIPVAADLTTVEITTLSLTIPVAGARKP